VTQLIAATGMENSSPRYRGVIQPFGVAPSRHLNGPLACSCPLPSAASAAFAAFHRRLPASSQSPSCVRLVFTRTGLTRGVQTSSGAGTAAAERTGPEEPSWDRPDGLEIRERRAWATWQLAIAGFVCLIVGMMIGYSGKRPATVATAGVSTRVTLPGSGGSTAANGHPATSLVASAPESTAAPTTLAPATAPVSAAAACNTPKGTLLPNTPGSGPSDLPAFSATGPFCIGWVYNCAGAPGGSGPFLISVSGGGASVGPPAVQESNRQGSGVTPQTVTGTQRLRVSSDPGCRWAIKVTST
jgi:hypothetical protein